MSWFTQPRKRKPRLLLDHDATQAALESRLLMASCMDAGTYTEPFTDTPLSLQVFESQGKKGTGVFTDPEFGSFAVKLKCKKGKTIIKVDTPGGKGKMTLTPGPGEGEYTLDGHFSFKDAPYSFSGNALLIGAPPI